MSEGFQAADLSLIGEKGLAQAEQEEEPELNSQGQFRIPAGYSSFVNCLWKKTGLKKNLSCF